MQNGNIQILQDGIEKEYILSERDIGRIANVTMTIMSKVTDLTVSYKYCIFNRFYKSDELSVGQIMKPNGEFLDVPNDSKIRVIFEFLN